jgi:hypothetical protein
MGIGDDSHRGSIASRLSLKLANASAPSLAEGCQNVSA